MKEGTLIIDGKTYISSARAAQLVGYTKDYVGQLARAGKIDSKLIGRSWYVAEDSITKHKLTVHYTLTKPKKPRQKVEAESSRDNDDKTIKNKDISLNGDIYQSNKNAIPPSYADVYDGDTESSPESHELYPVLKKKSNFDPLVNSEIFFEPQPISYEHDTHAQAAQIPEKKSIERDSDTLHVRVHSMPQYQSLRKQPLNSQSSRLKAQGTRGVRPQRIRMDDIVVPEEERMSVRSRINTELPARDYNEQEPFSESALYSYDDVPTRKLHTRTVSFIGAVMIVVGVVFLYALF